MLMTFCLRTMPVWPVLPGIHWWSFYVASSSREDPFSKVIPQIIVHTISFHFAASQWPTYHMEFSFAVTIGRSPPLEARCHIKRESPWHFLWTAFPWWWRCCQLIRFLQLAPPPSGKRVSRVRMALKHTKIFIHQLKAHWNDKSNLSQVNTFWKS